MALRLRRDVQKASYYVWFLGAQEARGLRGPRVIFPAVPRLLERSRSQEPLKVTLQVSHKGLKIIQGSAKHFIPHGAITCSIQSGDIVACVLLLYNPATRCPLHVHAYRCDSETTAEALHNQLQVLVNRPENQRRFAELETRLGLNNPASPPVAIPPVQNRRFESSLGSDTGTSTRESECSEDQITPTTPASLYDSLAAELRQKLGGGGPPLLLPPRDYDTVHRSKGNLAATELRRCRTSTIVGQNGPVTSLGPVSPQGVSSRGSSGFGSDLAPSPERTDQHSSSDEEWNHDLEPTVFLMHEPRRQRSGKSFEREYRDDISRTPTSSVRDENIRYRNAPSAKTNLDPRYDDRKIEREDYKERMRYKEYTPKYRDEVIPYKDDYREDEIRYRNRYVNDRERYREEGVRYSAEVGEKYVAEKGQKYREDVTKYREDVSKYRDGETNEPKYVEETSKYREDIPKYREELPKFREETPKYRDDSSKYREDKLKYREEKQNYREELKYRDDSLKYREETQKYNEKNLHHAKYAPQKENKVYRDRYRESEKLESRKTAEQRQRSVSSQRQSETESPGPLSPRDRFNDAKEKFQNLERARQQEQLVRKQRSDSRGWSSDEEEVHKTRPSNLRRHDSSANHSPNIDRSLPPFRRDPSPEYRGRNIPTGYVELPPRERHPGLDRLPSSKSLGNLSKGYRHSYAEPARRHPAMPPSVNSDGIRSGVTPRVGIAAVHHY